MRSGTPGIAFVGTSRLSISVGSPWGGGKRGGGFSLSTLKASRTAAPRRSEVEVVEREIEAPVRLAHECGQLGGDVPGLLAAVRQGAELDRQASPRTRR
jgi:hypothetical protein